MSHFGQLHDFVITKSNHIALFVKNPPLKNAPYQYNNKWMIFSKHMSSLARV